MRAATILPKEFGPMQITSRSRFARRSRLLALATVGAALALPVSAQADDAFLKLPGPDLAGEVMDKTFPGTIQVQSLSWGIENSATLGSASSGAGAGKANFKEFEFKKGVDRASPGLMAAVGQGRVLPAARLSIRKTGVAGAPYLEYQLEQVIVTGYDVSHSSGDGPSEDVKLAVGKISQRYSPSGNMTPSSRDMVSANWDRLTNTGGLGGFPDIPIK